MPSVNIFAIPINKKNNANSTTNFIILLLYIKNYIYLYPKISYTNIFRSSKYLHKRIFPGYIIL